MEKAELKLQTYMSIGLGVICGALIMLPPMLTGMVPSSSSGFLLLFGAGFGALNGYRWRESRAFFYFSSVAILLLSGLYMFHMFEL